MLPKILNKISSLFPEARKRMISDLDGNPYLMRMYILPDRGKETTFRPGLFLHKFFRSDDDRALHNHPWRFAISFILYGGYQEERLIDGKVKVFDRKPFTFNIIRANDFHRVKLNDEQEGCWSIFLAFDRTQEWGFLDIDTNEYLRWDIFVSKARKKRQLEDIAQFFMKPLA